MSRGWEKHYCIIDYLILQQPALPYTPAVECPLVPSHPMQNYGTSIGPDNFRGVSLLEHRVEGAVGTNISARWNHEENVRVEDQLVKTASLGPQQKNSEPLQYESYPEQEILFSSVLKDGPPFGVKIVTETIYR